jgi:hypothetical protein
VAFETFTAEFGHAQPGTAADPAELGLAHSAGIAQFVDEVGGGVFSEGFLSLVSSREAIDGLEGWERWVPVGSRLFGCSAFGVLLTTRGDDVWVVDTQDGEVVESDVALVDVIDVLATPASRDEVMRFPLFREWRERGGALAPTEVLNPVPPLAFGGDWAVDRLSRVSLPVYLSITAQLFAPDDVVVRRAG